MAKHLCGNDNSVVIIGGGIGGLSMAIALKERLGFGNFTIYEKASDVGGTWRDNTYPNCGSDVPIHFYSLSTDLNPKWDKSHGSQPEIQAYWQALARKYGLLPHVIFNTKVTSATWNIAEQSYDIHLENVKEGTTSRTKATIIVSAIGILEDPRIPVGLKGVDQFKGEWFHSARWDHGVDLKGKKVAVIGNGASATQFVPVITADPRVTVTQFCRTRAWYTNIPRVPYSKVQKWVFENVPGAMRLYRNFIFAKGELLWSAFVYRFVNQHLMKTRSAYMLETAPKQYHAHLIPKHPILCKRILIDSNYLTALHRPNLTPYFGGISRITETGLVTESGEEIAFDVIILATGFTSDKYQVDVRGPNGKSVQDYYDEQHGPTAYLGTTIPGFPNFYMLAGPNTGTGHTSVIFTEECQIDYAMHFIEPVIRGTASSFEVKSEACDRYNDTIQYRLSHTILTQCHSWYRAGGDGKIFSNFPGPVALFWWWTKSPVWNDYKAIGAEKWKREQRKKQWVKSVKLALTALSLVWLYSKRVILQQIWMIVSHQPLSDTYQLVRHIAMASLTKRRKI